MAKLILIADDNADNIFLIRKLISRAHLDVEIAEAQTGRDALSLAIQRRPAVILLDMKMPDMDGYETASALKAMEETRRIPIVAVTAQAMVGDKEKALEAGCDEYISKPIEPEILVRTIQKYLERT
ncbi:MAG: response regulator [Candidatus Kryptoniota bacterium]